MIDFITWGAFKDRPDGMPEAWPRYSDVANESEPVKAGWQRVSDEEYAAHKSKYSAEYDAWASPREEAARVKIEEKAALLAHREEYLEAMMRRDLLGDEKAQAAIDALAVKAIGAVAAVAVAVP